MHNAVWGWYNIRHPLMGRGLRDMGVTGSRCACELSIEGWGGHAHLYAGGGICHASRLGGPRASTGLHGRVWGAGLGVWDWQDMGWREGYAVVAGSKP